MGTHRIGVKPATNLLHGVRFASESGRALSLCATLGWHWAGLDADQAKNVFKALRQKVRRRWTYLRDKRGLNLGPFDDVGSHEAPADRANTHWMIRIPPALVPDFEMTIERLVKKLLPHADLTRLIHFQEIHTPGSLAKYVLKGIDPAFQGYFHIEAVDQGFIPGRGRTFVSRSLSLSARRAANWKRTRRQRATGAGPMLAQGRTEAERPPA